MKTSRGINLILKENKRNKELNKDLSLTLDNNPGLMIYYIGETPLFVYGIYRVIDNNGIEQGNWNIKIPIPKNYPYEFPQLIETSKKIEPGEENHISENGKACVELDIISEGIGKNGITITDFIKRYVLKYFCWQLKNSTEDKDNLESWKHKDEGRKEFFYTTLKTNDDVFVLKCIDILKKRTMPGRNKECFCGSGNDYKKCHETQIKELDRYGRDILIKYEKLFYPINCNTIKTHTSHILMLVYLIFILPSLI